MITKGDDLKAYFHQRLKQVNVSEEDIKLHVQRESPTGFFSVEMPLIEANEKGGLDFYHVDHNGFLAEYQPPKKQNKTSNRWEAYKHTRNHPIQLKENPKLPKCIATADQKTIPWLAPITAKLSKEGKKIKSLWIGEGALKVLSLQPHGICGIGTQGYHSFRFEENTRKILHPFITGVIEKCKPETLIYFQDGDARAIKEKVIYSDGKLDMMERSSQFFSAVNNFHKAALPVAREHKIKKILYVSICDARFKGEAKGIDDLLEVAREEGLEKEVLEEIRLIEKGKYSAKYKYFYVINITRNTMNAKRWFCLHSHQDFAELHIEEIYETKCRFGHKIYFVECNDDQTEVTLELISDARVNQYMKIGTNYYKKCKIPFNNGENFYLGRLKTDATTIIQQIGKRAAKRIPLYDGFCNIPNYRNHRESIGSFFNIQHPLPKPIAHKCSDKQLTTIFSLIDHISKNASVMHKGELLDGRELVLDYLQLLLFHREGEAVQRLPFFCLVSEEQGSGKSTVGDFLINELLGDNHIKIQNSDFSSDFNEPYATRRAVTIEEANFSKSDENRLKDLTGSDFILVNGKNDKQAKYSNVLVLIMVSNDEKRFSFVSKDDTRHWVIKVDSIKTKDVGIKQKVRAEIPYFYRYLLDRELYLLKKFPEDIDRYYFPPYAIRTEAWKKAVRYSMPKDCEPIRDYIEELFLFLDEKKEGVDELHYTAKDIRELVFEGKGDDRRIGEYLRDIFKLEYKSYNKRSGKPQNSRYQKLSIVGFDDTKAVKRISNIAKCFVFPRKQFVSDKNVTPWVTKK